MPPPSSVVAAPARPARARGLAGAAGVLWRFGRPHTLIGTTVSVLALFALALDGAGASAGTAVFHLALTLLAALAVNVFIVGVNELEDVEIDRVNKPFLPIPAGELSVPAARRTVAVAAALPVALAVTQGAIELAAVLVALAVGWAYSCPPARLKRWPVPAAASITLVRSLVVNLGVSLHFTAALRDERVVDPGVWVLVAVTIPFAMAIAVLKDVPDLEGDRAHGIRTFTVRLGPARALALGLGALALAAAGTAASAFALLPLVPAAALALLALGSVAVLALQARTAAVTATYQRVWRLFFATYLAVPAAFLIA